MKSEIEKWTLIGKPCTVSQSKEGLEGVYVNPDSPKTVQDAQYLLRQRLDIGG